MRHAGSYYLLLYSQVVLPTRSRSDMLQVMKDHKEQSLPRVVLLDLTECLDQLQHAPI